ncbi:MAG: AMP-binding protein [Rickettsiales bacterium]|jgi:long-chain acyl-CoA synthetase|nr:AMP-binding protein [Rickettsiales bacterium]
MQLKWKNAYDFLADSVKANSQRVFFVRENKSYADLLRMVQRRAVLLKKRFDIKRGDVVGLLSENIPEFIASYFAVVSLGAKSLMLDAQLAKGEIKNMLAKTKAKLIIAQKKFWNDSDSDLPLLDIQNIDDTDESEFVPENIELDEIASLSFTSGSTGKSKIVGLSHKNVVALAQGAELYSPVIKPGYMFYGFLPLNHVYGFVINMIAPLTLNCSLLLQQTLNPKLFLEDFKKFHPEVVPAVPRVWEVFQKKITDGYKEKRAYWILRFVVATRGFWRAIGLGGLVRKITKPVFDTFGGKVKVLVSAGATLKPSTRKFYERLGFSVGDCYGLTETTGPSNFNFQFRLNDGTMHYAGPLPGNEVQIRNADKDGVGDIYVRGLLVMPGYIENEEANKDAFDKDGWFKTGDVGVFDKRGRLTVKARKKQIIVLDSGKNVYPDELEDLYLQNDAVLMAAVFERVIQGKTVAFGVFQVKPETTMTELSLLIAASNLKIAPYKWVTHFAMTTEELPMTSAQKIKHHEVIANLDAGKYPNMK